MRTVTGDSLTGINKEHWLNSQQFRSLARSQKEIKVRKIRMIRCKIHIFECSNTFLVCGRNSGRVLAPHTEGPRFNPQHHRTSKPKQSTDGAPTRMTAVCPLGPRLTHVCMLLLEELRSEMEVEEGVGALRDAVQCSLHWGHGSVLPVL